jgi:hypothetical protein
MQVHIQLRTEKFAHKVVGQPREQRRHLPPGPTYLYEPTTPTPGR